MRLVLLVILAMILGYGFMQVGQIDPSSYAKLYFNGNVVEMKLLVFVLLTILTILLLFLTMYLLKAFWRSPSSFFSWNKRRNKTKSEQQFGQGYLSLIKGDWSKAESQLLSKPQYSDVPYVNYLAAAQAAQQQGRIEKRDDYLKLAYKVAPKEELAIALTKAKLHQQAGQFEHALAALQNIKVNATGNSQYTAMLAQCYEHLQDWTSLQALLPTLKKQKALPKAVFDDMQSQAYRHNLLQAPEKQLVWQSLPKEQKHKAANVAIYARHLIETKQHSAAQKLIQDALKRDYSDELVMLYSQVESDKPEKQLRQVQGWLMAREDQPQLLVAAASLAIKCKQADLSKEYLQKVIDNSNSDPQATAQAYALLGRLFESEKQAGKALQLYRQGVEKLGQVSTLVPR